MISLFTMIFILLEIIIRFTKCVDNNQKEIKVSHRILDQKLVYNDSHTIYNTFIDFINFKMYNISKIEYFIKMDLLIFN